jgi:two-component system phosphate regulon sensor histidine kinase PhoR
MFWRIVSFLVCQGVGGLIGWWFVPAAYQPLGDLTGVFLGGLLWFLLDLSRGLRVLRWLRAGDVSDVPMRVGLWGEVSDRMRRQVRAREQKIRESDHRLQDFLEALQASPNGVVLLDLQGRIEWCNQMACAHFGLDAQRDLLQHFGNLVRDPGFAAYYAQADFSAVLAMPGRDSSLTRPVRLSVQLHPYGEGRLLLLSRDTTALEQAETMRRDFVANVSHEIRTPLTVLSGFVETLQTLPLNEEERTRYLDLMSRQADRMQTLVSDLLTLSRLEGAPPPATTEWVPLRHLMQHVQQEGTVLSSVLYTAIDRQQTLQFESTLEVDLAGSMTELQSALSNLVSNAVRYTPSSGVIRVWTEWLSDGRVRFAVQDTGPGIAPEHVPRLTERFYRVDRSRSRDTGGTGLGLAIVKHVAQRHGIELAIDSTVGKGSVFSLVFPASRIRLAVAGVIRPLAAAASAAAPSSIATL